LFCNNIEGQDVWVSEADPLKHIMAYGKGGYTVRNRKLLVAGLAAVIAASSIEAVAYLKPSGKPGIESSIEFTAGKKKTKKKAANKKVSKKNKAAKVAAATKSCGTFMYRKDGKCLDARDKK
jgi:hypothetical protein